VTENILLGLDRPRFRMNLRASDAEVARLADQFGLRVDPRAKIWQLSVGEVLAIADRITVMRRGVVTAAGLLPRETSTTDLARRMVGRDVLETVQRTPQKPGPTVLAVSDVTAENDRGLPALRG